MRRGRGKGSNSEIKLGLDAVSVSVRLVYSQSRREIQNCSVRRQLLVEARVEVEENVHGPEDQVQDGVELQKQVLHRPMMPDRYNSPYPVPFAQNPLQAFYL